METTRWWGQSKAAFSMSLRQTAEYWIKSLLSCSSELLLWCQKSFKGSVQVPWATKPGKFQQSRCSTQHRLSADGKESLMCVLLSHRAVAYALVKKKIPSPLWEFMKTLNMYFEIGLHRKNQPCLFTVLSLEWRIGKWHVCGRSYHERSGYFCFAQTAIVLISQVSHTNKQGKQQNPHVWRALGPAWHDWEAVESSVGKAY